MDLTLFELHLEGSTFNAPFATGNDDAPTPSEDAPESDDDSETGAAGSGFDLRPLVVLAVLLGLALLARFLRSGESTEEGSEAAVEEIDIES